MSTPEPTETCVGCGARVPILESPGHPYIGASPGCWGVFLQGVAREYGEYGYPSFHHLTVDTYGVAGAGSLAQHEAAVRHWACLVWNSWAGHRETIRRWAER